MPALSSSFCDVELTDAVDVGQTDLDPLVERNVYSGDTSHLQP